MKVARRPPGAHRSALPAFGALGVLVGVTWWAVYDYRQWRALGVGGLPPTLTGWLTVTRMRFKAGDPFHVPGAVPAQSTLATLKQRDSARPRVAPHPIPHRVLDQPAPQALIARLMHVFDEFEQSTTPALVYRISLWEKNNPALFLDTPALADSAAGQARWEIGHVHPSDGSVHVTLAPDDAAAVIAKRWGELHPLAGRMAGLPATYTLLYPPRNDTDLDAVRTIVAAAISHASASQLQTTG